MKILVLNSGSSSLKFALYESAGEQVLTEGLMDWSTTPARLTIRSPGQPEVRAEVVLRQHSEAVGRVLQELTRGEARVLSSLSEVGAVGHRVVHGGDRYTASVRVTAEVKAAIAELAELAPLHNPGNLEGILAAEAALPGVPQVVVFDTAFHATIPPAAHVYAVPYAWYTDWKVRRYGFHGISHAYCADRAAAMLGLQPKRLITCHLGAGASVSAVRDGRCVDTSMGFTPLEGVMMASRSGSVDPGLLLHLLRRKGLTAVDLDRILNHESGLLGVSGVSADMRQVLAAASAGNERARLALDVYVHRLRQTIGGMAASLGGVDALVFTAGVGEHAAAIREATCAGLGYLGLELDTEANERCQPDADVATTAARGRILVLATREDLVIVRETAAVIGNHESHE